MYIWTGHFTSYPILPRHSIFQFLFLLLNKSVWKEILKFWMMKNLNIDNLFRFFKWLSSFITIEAVNPLVILVSENYNPPHISNKVIIVDDKRIQKLMWFKFVGAQPTFSFRVSRSSDLHQGPKGARIKYKKRAHPHLHLIRRWHHMSYCNLLMLIH